MRPGHFGRIDDVGMGGDQPLEERVSLPQGVERLGKPALLTAG